MLHFLGSADALCRLWPALRGLQHEQRVEVRPCRNDDERRSPIHLVEGDARLRDRATGTRQRDRFRDSSFTAQRRSRRFLRAVGEPTSPGHPQVLVITLVDLRERLVKVRRRHPCQREYPKVIALAVEEEIQAPCSPSKQRRTICCRMVRVATNSEPKGMKQEDRPGWCRLLPRHRSCDP